MPDAMRVRLYEGKSLEADTDPDAPPGTAGSEVVEDLAASQRALVELREAFHGSDVRLLGFSDMARAAYLEMLRRRAADDELFSYSQAYTVLLDTPQLRRATRWRAQVDIAIAQ